jgi:hypothetical protein
MMIVELGLYLIVAIDVPLQHGSDKEVAVLDVLDLRAAAVVRRIKPVQ